VLDPSTVAAAIKSLWSQTRFSSRKVVLGVANQKVIVRQVDLPWLPPDELKRSLGYSVQDFLPVPVDQVVLDFHPLEEHDADGRRMVRGLLVAAGRDMVSSAVAAVQAAGLRPVAVDLASFAVLRSLGQRDDLGMGAPVEALVDVGAKVTNLVVHQGGVPRFVRILLLGGQDVTDALAERLGLPAAEAEAAKQALTDASPEGLASGGNAVVETTATTFANEVRSSLDYFSASSGGRPVERLVLTGGGSRLRGLARRLQAVTSLPVEVGQPLAAMQIGKTGLSPEQLDFVAPLAAVPVGLAMAAAR
jgi:type IV pilus assembly protein PilM